MQLDETAFPDPVGLADRPHRRRVLSRPHQEGGRLSGRRRASHAAGALGDRGRLLPVDDGVPDRRADRRRRHRPPEWRRGGVGDLPGHRRLLAAPDREVDVHHHRPGRRRQVLHPHRGRRRPRTTATPGSTPTAPAFTRSATSSTPASSSWSDSASRPPTIATSSGSLAETDRVACLWTPRRGRMWHRYTHDGYGEKADGSPWDGTGIGRLWPLLSGERGEYVLANDRDALSYLQTMHNSANDGYMIPEQAWDQPEPTTFGHTFGKGTGSAAPLAWAMAQYVRLAQGIAAGRPVETPAVVARRYATGRQLNVADAHRDQPRRPRGRQTAPPSAWPARPAAVACTSASTAASKPSGSATSRGGETKLRRHGVAARHPQPTGDRRCRSRRRNQHARPYRARLRQPDRRSGRSRRRRQRARHLQVSHQPGIPAGNLRPHRSRRVRPRRPMSPS